MIDWVINMCLVVLLLQLITSCPGHMTRHMTHIRNRHDPTNCFVNEEVNSNQRPVPRSLPLKTVSAAAPDPVYTVTTDKMAAEPPGGGASFLHQPPPVAVDVFHIWHQIS